MHEPLPRLGVTFSTPMAVLYHGLIASGYEYAQWDKPPEVLAIVDEALRFFAQARQGTCDVYPFWPRTALMETATFYMECSPEQVRFADVDGYHAFVMQADNLRNDERDESFWQWVGELPGALRAVTGARGLRQRRGQARGGRARQGTEGLAVAARRGRPTHRRIHRPQPTRVRRIGRLLLRCWAPLRHRWSAEGGVRRARGDAPRPCTPA